LTWLGKKSVKAQKTKDKNVRRAQVRKKSKTKTRWWAGGVVKRKIRNAQLKNKKRLPNEKGEKSNT